VTNNWLELAWEIREERVYPSLFGSAQGGIYILDQASFAPFNVDSIDPRWLFHGVFKFPPTATRQTWVYVTSGLSNAWGDEEPSPDGPSGLGCELVFETTADFDWAVQLTQGLLAFQILLGWGRIKGKELLTVGDRVPLRSPIDHRSSSLTWALICPPRGYDASFNLPSGEVELLHVIGSTNDEAAFARERGYQSALDLLADRGYPVTDPLRTSAVVRGET
jgi:hypothetical protein